MPVPRERQEKGGPKVTTPDISDVVAEVEAADRAYQLAEPRFDADDSGALLLYMTPEPVRAWLHELVSRVRRAEDALAERERGKGHNPA